jgi:hypothetical protein
MTTITHANRITAAIGRYQTRIDGFGGEDANGLSGKRIGDMHTDMALSFQEFIAFQNAQARAHASGKLSADEAMTVYRALGGEVYKGDWPDGTTLAAKVTLTQLMSELIR